MGLAFVAVFCFSVAFGSIPITLIQPAWQVRFAGLLLAAAPSAAIGAVLIILAQLLDEDSEILERWARRIRHLAIAAAIGFFLLIPLQTYSGYKLLRSAAASDLEAIGPLRKSLSSLQAATTEDQFRVAVQQIPGAPQNLGRLNLPLAEAKKRIGDRLSGRINELSNLAEERNATRWQRSLLGWARSCLISLCYATGFAAMGKTPKSRQSFLTSVLAALPWNRGAAKTPVRFRG
jgi:hypothetical protein